MMLFDVTDDGALKIRKPTHQTIIVLAVHGHDVETKMLSV